jgi:hypothetical protein
MAGKVSCRYVMKTYGAGRFSSPSFLASAIDGGEWPASAPEWKIVSAELEMMWKKSAAD